MLAGAFVVRRRDNEGVVADANKLGIVRPQDLGPRDAHEAFQNLIGSRFRIPSGIEKLGVFQGIDHLLPDDLATDIGTCCHVLFGEGCHQDIGLAPSIAIIHNPDQTLRILDAVRIGDSGAFVQEQSLVPRLTIVGRESGREMAAPLKFVMVHKEKIAGPESADEEARPGVGDGRCHRFTPGAAAIGRFAFPEKSSARANQHPERSIPAFDDHVLQGPGRSFEGTMKAPGFSIVLRDRHPLALFCLGEPREYFFAAVRHRHHPLARGKHRGFVHAKAVGRFQPEAEFFSPDGDRRIGFVADPGMHAMHAGLFIAAVEDQPKLPCRIDPKSGVKSPRLAGRQNDRRWFSKGLAAVVTGAEINGILRLRFFSPAGKPCDKKTALCGLFDSGNSLPNSFGRFDIHAFFHFLIRASAQRSAINSIPASLGCTDPRPRRIVHAVARASG